MDAVNAATKRVFDLAWGPLGRLPAWIGLLVLGVVFGVLALIAMKYTTNPKRVERFKDRYQGHILAIKLFRDSFVVVVGSLAKTLAWVGAYLGEQCKPMLLMLIPFVLLFAQMQMRLGYGPVALGEKVIVSVELAEGRSPMEVRMNLPAGVEPVGPPVREPALERFVVQVRASTPGAHSLGFDLGGETVHKTLVAGDLPGMPMVSPVRSQGVWDRVLYPGEAAFGAGSAFRRIELRHPVRPIPLFGFDLSFGSELGMMLWFVVITIAAAFGLKGVFGVTI